MSFPLFVITLFLSIAYVAAYPFAAGGCRGGRAAVGALHLVLRPTISRNLTASKIQIKLGGTTVSEGGSITKASKVNQAITVSGIDFKKFRGVLIRIETTDGTSTKGVVTPNAGFQNANVCKSPIVGITHRNATLKSSAGGIIKFPTKTSGVRIGVTVVFVARVGAGSSYAYGNFTANFT